MPKDNEAPVEVIQGDEEARAESMMLPKNADHSALVAAIERAGWEAVATIAEDRGDANVAAHARHRLAYQSEAPAQGEGMVCPQIAMGHGLVDVGQIHWQGRKGIVFHPRDNFIPIGEKGDLKGDYWPVAADVVIWIDSPGGADTIISELTPLATPSLPLADREAIAREVFRRTGCSEKCAGDAADAILALSGSLPPSPVGEGVRMVSDELAARLDPASDIQPVGQPKLSPRRIKRKPLEIR